MPATVITFTPSADDMPKSGGLYSELDVPGDYEVVLDRVEDYDNGPKRKGWIFFYDCETPSGGHVEFKHYLNFNATARWKITETFAAHGDAVSEEAERAWDANALIGQKVGAHIDFGTDRETGEPTIYREIKRVFALAEAPQPVALEAEAPEAI